MRSAALVSLLVALAWNSPVSAQWRQNGIPACQDSSGQDQPKACSDGSGGVFVAWRDGRNYSTLSSDIYLQHMTAAGFVSPGWPPNGLALCSIGGYQDASSLTSDGLGGCFVTWIDQRNGPSDIYAQHITADGVPAAGWPHNGLAICTAFGYQSSPQIEVDGTGGCFVSWDDARNGDSKQAIYLDRVLASGTLDPVWPVNGRIVAQVSGSQGGSRSCPDGHDGVFITWADGRALGASGFDVYLQRMTSLGTIASGWPASGMAITTAPGDQGPHSAVQDDAGGVYLVWGDPHTRDPNPIDFDLYAQHVSASGVLVPGWPTSGFAVGKTGGQKFYFAADLDGQGGLLVAWQVLQAGVFVYAQRLRYDGTPAPGWAVSGNRASTAQGGAPRVAQDGTGGAYLAWLVSGIDSYADLYSQHLTAAGVPAPGWGPEGLPLCIAPKLQEYMQLVSAGSSGAVATWGDLRNYAASGDDIYAQRLGVDGPVPVALSLVSAEGEPGLARISWFAADAADLGAIVERRDDATEWVPLGAPNLGGTGLLTYEDLVPAGGRYAYRLRYGPAQETTEPAWITIPSGLALSLAGFRPNPAVGSLKVSLSLPSGDPATLELVDVAGRRLLSRELGGLGPGSHLVELGSSATLRPGVYWLRLTQKGRSLTARGLVLR